MIDLDVGHSTCFHTLSFNRFYSNKKKIFRCQISTDAPPCYILLFCLQLQVLKVIVTLTTLVCSVSRRFAFCPHIPPRCNVTTLVLSLLHFWWRVRDPKCRLRYPPHWCYLTCWMILAFVSWLNFLVCKMTFIIMFYCIHSTQIPDCSPLLIVLNNVHFLSPPGCISKFSWTTLRKVNRFCDFQSHKNGICFIQSGKLRKNVDLTWRSIIFHWECTS